MEITTLTISINLRIYCCQFAYCSHFNNTRFVFEHTFSIEQAFCCCFRKFVQLQYSTHWSRARLDITCGTGHPANLSVPSCPVWTLICPGPSSLTLNIWIWNDFYPHELFNTMMSTWWKVFRLINLVKKYISDDATKMHWRELFEPPR